jgi:hypothetical protein
MNYITLLQLNEAISTCDSGDLQFNTGNIRAFLFGNKWYPLRAIINYINKKHFNITEQTTDRALVQFAFAFPFIRIKEVHFSLQKSVELSLEETLEEIH